MSLRSHASVQKHKTRHRPIPGESDIARFCADRARRGDANPQQRLYVAAGRAHRHRPGIAERDRGSASRALSAEASLTAPTRTFVRQLRGRHPSARSTARAQKRDRWAFPHSDGHPGEPSEPDAELGARMPRKGGLPSDQSRVPRRVERGLLRIGSTRPGGVIACPRRRSGKRLGGFRGRSRANLARSSASAAAPHGLAVGRASTPRRRLRGRRRSPAQRSPADRSRSGRGTRECRP